MSTIIWWILLAMFVIIIVKTGSLGKAIHFAFGNLFKFWIWPFIFGFIGYCVGNKTGAAIGVAIGSIFSLLKRKKRFDEITRGK